MSCFKCSKETKRQPEVFIEKTILRCAKCVSKCLNVDCKRKPFKNGFCSSHVTIVNKKYEKFKGRVDTEVDYERRNKMRKKEEAFQSEVDQLILLIEYQKHKMKTTDCIGGSDTLRELERNLREKIKIHNDRIDDEIEVIKETSVRMFNENLSLMFAKGEYFPGYKERYQEYKGKFKEYKSHFDSFRQRKHRQERRKAERTRSRRSQERTFGEREERGSEDDKEEKEEDEEEDEDHYFRRTCGHVVLQEAFNVLEIDNCGDYDIIRKAYKKMSLRVHPDKHPGEEEKYNNMFLEVTTAYELIMTKLFPKLIN